MSDHDIQLFITKFSNSFDEFRTNNSNELKQIREYIFELKAKKFCDEHTNFIKEFSGAMGEIRSKLTAIAEHVITSTKYRTMTEKHEETLKNIKEEKLNTTKNAQWRVGLIVGVCMSILVTVINRIWK
jgi:hypothetical protein